MFKKIIKYLQLSFLLLSMNVAFASEDLGGLLLECDIEEVSEDSWFYKGYYFTSRFFDENKSKRIVIQRLLNHPWASDFKELGYDTTLTKVNIYSDYTGDLILILDRKNLKLISTIRNDETNCEVFDGYLEDMLKSWWDDRKQRKKAITDKNKI